MLVNVMCVTNDSCGKNCSHNSLTVLCPEWKFWLLCVNFIYLLLNSRDEIYEKNSRIHLDRSNTEIAKVLNITPVLDKIQEYKRKWKQHVNRMPHNRLPRIIK